MANTLKFKRGLLAGIPTAALGEPLFTTDTFDLYIGNGTGNTKFQKFIASGATTQIIRGDGSLYTFPLAISSPSNGQVLKYNGTSWVNDSDAGITGSGVAGQVAYFTGATTQSGSNNLFWDATNNRLGIGTNTIDAANKLQVEGAYLSVRGVGGGGGGFYTSWPNTSNADARTWGWGSSINVFGDFGISQSNAKDGNPITAGTLRLYISRLGNLLLGSTSDNGLRFQVTGDGYFSGSVGIGTSSITAYNLRNNKNITGGTTAFGHSVDGIVQTDVSSFAIYNHTVAQTTAGGTYANLAHYNANQGGIGGTLTNQFGYRVAATLTGATNNYGFYGDIASGTGRWNLYMNGTAANYLNGTLSIGTTITDYRLNVAAANLSTIGIIDTAEATDQKRWVFQYGTTVGAGTFRLRAINDANSNGQNAYVITRTGIAVDTHQWLTANAERMRLDASGNLGLGVTPSAWNSKTINFELSHTNRAGFVISHFRSSDATAGNAVNTGVGFYRSTADDSLRYINNFTKPQIFGFFDGSFIWNQAAAGTAGNPISFVQAMTLDASGNLGIGTTSPDSRLALSGSGTVRAKVISTDSQASFYLQGTFGQLENLAGELYITNTAASSPIIFRAGSSVERMRLFSDGNFGIGTGSTNAGYKLDVNGTMRVSGETTITTNTDSATGLLISNTNTGTSARARIRLGSANSNWFFDAFRIGGRLSISNDISGTATELFQIANTGAATFSSSVTAASFNGTTNNIFSTAGTEKMRLDSLGQLGLGATPYAWGGSYKSFDFLFGSIANTNAGNVDVAITQNAYFDGTNWISKYTGASKRYVLSDGGHIWFNGASATSGTAITMTQAMILNASGNLGIAMTPSYKLDVTGQARISDAIAIGTTPDTNLPFKILKNINSTVGIRFENTSTGASAYSAVQFGTDVNGGTAFTNMVYGSSGITESGVYKPNGTAIINTGSGGLNFLAVSQPIRFFTSTGNGTLRAEIANDGFINHYTGTAPTTNLTDGYRQYSADITAGNAAPHFRTENGSIIKLYQQTTAVTSATYIGGAGTTVTDLDTFDGYTIPQIVKALRNAGLLA